MLRNRLFLLLLCLLPFLAAAQEDRFEEEIRDFEEDDSQSGYKSDFILLTGSSSIRLWHSLEKDLKGFDVLNRGFGGSTLYELDQYWGRIAGDHQPELVIVYCGENDIADGATVTETVDRFKTFLDSFSKTYPSTPMIYIAMKPSISRWNLWPKYQEADRQIREVIATQENVTFIDLGASMLLRDGTLKQNIFIEDGLHMNKKGYRGWRKLLRPAIKNALDN